MLLLFIEDNESSVQPVINRLQGEQTDVECIVKDFGDASVWLGTNRPDVVSLDMVLDGSSGDARLAGQPIHDHIWQNNFCPIIVYSAQPEEFTAEDGSHPFVRLLKKGKGSPAQFAKIINEFRPHVNALRTAETQVRREFAVAMRDFAPKVFEQIESPEERQRIITRSGRRRLAAQMDDFTDYEGGDETNRLAAWEHYLCPPVDADLVLGDILRTKGCDVNNPESYRVVLTPSCDLVASGGRSPKVPNVLVAKCFGMKEALAAVNIILGAKAKKNEDKLSSVLSQSFIRNIFPFPRFANIIPTMAADFKQLELIPFDRLHDGFDRVASLDSPFREVVSWAYMQTGCRPALPDRELDYWISEIVEAVKRVELNEGN